MHSATPTLHSLNVTYSLPRPHHFRSKIQRIASEHALASAFADSQSHLPRFRNFLKQGDALIRRYHRAGGSGLRVVNCRAILIDVMLEHLFAAATQASLNDTQPDLEPPALLALGGYGRSEMCPLSDVDIMFVYPQKPKSPAFPDFQAKLNDRVLYTLWDLNLKVGHATRSVKEALAEAEAEVQSKNAMMEARLITGSQRLYKDFSQLYERFIARDNKRAYLQERLEDQQQRRQRFHDSVFLQEPDIKNGVGGLRDYQNILWMARLRFGARDLSELVRLQLLRASELAALTNAYDFLLRTRNELHFQSKRATDTLNIDQQPKVAWNLGYRHHAVFERVERFMRDYYSAAKSIFQLSVYLEQRISTEARTSISFAAVIESRRHAASKPLDGFHIVGPNLICDSPFVFKKDPVRLIRVFRHLQTHSVSLDFDIQRLIVENLDLIDDKLRASPEANRAFRSILQTKGAVFPALNLMNSTGVLQRFIPEWNRLHCLVQHEFYHRYTADEHTLNTIRHLDAIFSGSDVNITQKYRDALEATEIPALLYLALLLHDIGKGTAIENHAQIGASLAAPICERLGLPENVRRRVLFLITHHLEMARFWQRFDIDDPQTPQSFAQIVEDPDNLRYLFALTFCDAKGTTEQLWNSFKDTLHFQLFSATMKTFSSSPKKMRDAAAIDRPAVEALLPNVPSDEIDAHFNLLPERYFNYHSEADVALHIRMIHALLKTIASADSLGALVPVVEWQDDLNLGFTVVNIVTWDRAGLFYKLAGAFSLAGLSILSSKAMSRSDHITIDTFYVVQPGGGIVTDQSKFEKFQSILNDTLLHNRNLLEALDKRAAAKSSSLLQRTTTLPTAIPPKVEIYHELSLRRTIIEIEANDEIGLLYRLTHAIFSHGYDITFARISTERNVAVDTFYIEPVPPKESSDPTNLVNLRADLLKIVEAAAPATN